MPFDDSVQPLRISKSTPSSTPQKMSGRVLGEISAGSMRRNSPSYNQATRKMIVTKEASPYTENSFTKTTSPNSENVLPKLISRDFWTNRDSSQLDVENSFTESLRSPSPAAEASPRRRPSVERLQQASRVKNSKIFALENKAAYDPASVPMVERPTANRPLSQSFANNSFTRLDSLRKDNSPLRSPQRGHKRSETELSVPVLTPTKTSPNSSLLSERATSPASDSPTKSSLSRRLYSPSADNSLLWGEEDRCSTPRALHRQNKSVTFESNPPMINEYENPTPEPSVAASNDSREGSYDDSYEEGDSYERGSSVDDSFDADLENADKTPVVLPDHYSNISQEEARKNLIDDDDDVFESSVIHNAQHDAFRRSVSVASDGSTRPLPPLPSMAHPLRKKESQRLLAPRAESEEIVIRNLDTGETKELRVNLNEAEVQDESVVAELEEFAASPPRISRESILAKVRGSKYDFDDEDDESFADATENAYLSYSELARFDPDEPVPSRELIQETIELQVTTTVQVKVEPEEEETFDLTTVPTATIPADVSSHTLRPEHEAQEKSDDDEDSRYSPTESEIQHSEAQTAFHETIENGESLNDAMSLLTVKDYSDSAKKTAIHKPDYLGLPSYQTGVSEWDLGMKEYCTPSPPVEEPLKSEEVPTPTRLNAFTTAPVLMPETDQAELDRAATPDSVLRRSDSVTRSSLDAVSTLAEEETAPYKHELYDGTHRPVSPVIPERRATIKTGGKLKARPSGTPAEFEALLTAPIDMQENPLPDFSSAAHKLDLNLDVPIRHSLEAEGDMLGLDREFDRVIENQKKGYLTRQNTKVVVASNRNVSGESNDSASTITGPPVAQNLKSSPRKASTEQHFKAEPWNGKQRRKSLRNASAQQGITGPAPPLPSQQSALDVVNEDRSLIDESEADIERGRLFIKVVGAQNLELPLPRNDRVDFKLTLDNGLHCVTTGALELGHTAPIGQEFELVVQSDLEFQLTLTTRLPPPPAKPVEIETPVPSSPTKTSMSTFSKFLSSPRKRAEKERQEREAAQLQERKRQEDLARKRASAQPTAWDMLRELVNSADGSFARAYVNLAEHENACFGRKVEVDVPLYNEWALEKDDIVVSSVRSKRGANWGPVRRPPYVIGQLKCQLLFVPKPKDAVDEDMPKSMSAAVREINKASEIVDVTHEGFLSQQGGDCVHWRRRFFSVSGSKLTAYHEHTHQKRAVINLSKASRLVDDRRTLVADPTSKSRSGRRKSAFAEEDEGYQYVEEGFRIRFANGETIDFYADSRAEKESWMNALAQVIGRPDQGSRKQKWTDLVLAQEKILGTTPAVRPTSAGADTATDVRDFVAAPVEAPPAPPAKEVVNRKSVQSALTSPQKRGGIPFPAPSPAKRPSTPPLQPRTGHRKRDQVKSMIF